MIFRSICFQVDETELFKHFFCRYFKVAYDVIKCRSTFVRNGITNKSCKARTIVLKKITKIYVQQHKLEYTFSAVIILINLNKTAIQAFLQFSVSFICLETYTKNPFSCDLRKLIFWAAF